MEISPSIKLRTNAERNRSIRKAIIPIAGLGTRFLPLSKFLPKEFFPLVDKPILEYLIKEVRESGLKEIVFVSQPGKKLIFDYFYKNNRKIKKILRQRKKIKILNEFKNWEETFGNLSFYQVFQEKQSGDGHAILQAKKLTKKEPVAVSFADDIVESKIPCLLQLIKVFKKYKRPVIALSRIPRKNLPSYGVVAVEKIERRIYRIKKIIEKPSIKEAPSNLAIVGKYVLTPDVFDYLSRTKVRKNQEIILAENLQEMIEDGLEVYGCEFEGKWLECGNKLAYLKSNLYFSLKNSQFGKQLKNYLKKEVF